MKRFYRSKFNKKITGLLGGTGEYFGIDPSLIRFAAIFVCIFTRIFPFIIIYFLLSLIIPLSHQRYPIDKKIYRSKDKEIAGICSAIAKLLKLDPFMVRIFMVILCFLTGIISILIFYVLGWIIIPEEK